MAGHLAGETPIRIEGIDHVVLRIRDLPQALSFYCGVLGCREERRIPEIGLVQLRAGRSLIDLLVANQSPSASTRLQEPSGRNMDHVALRLQEFDAARIQAYLAEQGVKAGPVESRYGAEGTGPSIYVADPEGNVVELKGPAEPG